jgi:hypothetical protein
VLLCLRTRVGKELDRDRTTRSTGSARYAGSALPVLVLLCAQNVLGQLGRALTFSDGGQAGTQIDAV